jgi:hypothetical protein
LILKASLNNQQKYTILRRISIYEEKEIYLSLQISEYAYRIAYVSEKLPGKHGESSGKQLYFLKSSIL